MKWNACWLPSRSQSLIGLKGGCRSDPSVSMHRVIASVFLTLAFASATGCNRVVLVPESSPIRVGPDARFRVYMYDGGQWVLGENKVTVPEGWYLVPPSFVEKP